MEGEDSEESVSGGIRERRVGGGGGAGQLQGQTHGYLVQDVREAVDQIRRGVTERTAGMKEAFNRGTGKLYHVITSNDRIVQFRIGVDGRLILENTVRSINLHTKKLKDARQKLINAGKEVPIRAQKQMRQAITGDPNKRIRDHMNEAPQVKMMDKISFTMGVVVITFTEYLIMRHPEWFTHFYTGLMLLLFLIRYFMYKQAKSQFFMLDFCYIVNLSCMIHSAFYKDNLVWFNANFALSMGPICSAIIVWQNSLVFHSLDKLTSFFLHSFPPMLYHLYRWRLIPTEVVKLDQSATLMDLFAPSIGIYICWQIWYLCLTEWLFKSSLDADPELVTSLRYLAKDKKNPLNKMVTSLCRSAGIIGVKEDLDPSNLKTKLIFLSTQLTYTSVLILPSYFVYKNYYACCLYLVSIFIAGTWNGASYYIEVFSKRYNLKFDKPVPIGEAAKGEDSDKLSEANEEDHSDEEEETYEEAVEDINLNESQAMELFELLEKLDEEGPKE